MIIISNINFLFLSIEIYRLVTVRASSFSSNFREIFNFTGSISFGKFIWIYCCVFRFYDVKGLLKKL